MLPQAHTEVLHLISRLDSEVDLEEAITLFHRLSSSNKRWLNDQTCRFHPHLLGCHKDHLLHKLGMVDRKISILRDLRRHLVSNKLCLLDLGDHPLVRCRLDSCHLQDFSSSNRLRRATLAGGD